MISLWRDTAKMPEFDPIEGNLATDILIIGGGIAGILTAYLLQQAGADYLLVEADRICSGVTGDTTGKITIQHGLLCHKLLQRFDEDRARQYLRANQAALRAYDALCREVDCEYERKDNYIYSMGDESEIEAELRAAQLLGIRAERENNTLLPFGIAGAVRFPNQAQFHPLKFLGEIAKDLNIREHTKVRELRGMTAITEHGKIRAKRIVVATHFPFLNKHGGYFLKMYQNRSYVIALENAGDVEGMYMDADPCGISLRNSGKYLLIGGGAHRTGKPGGAWAEPEKFARDYYPHGRIAYRWAAQDCITLDDVPYIGRYGKHTEDLYVATGFNKWGMTGAMAAAMLLRDRLTGKKNPFTEVFSPERTILRPRLAANLASSAAGLLTFSPKRCPHLGCALKWNPQEHSWDCPCHGSRFAGDGSLLDNPATDGLKQK